RVWEEALTTCIAPTWAAQELLYSEGFTDVHYVTWGRQTQNWVPEALLADEADISLTFIPSDLLHIDAGAPVVLLAGSHIGCIELIGNDRVSSTRDLKGKTVGISELGDPAQIFISMFAAYVGVNPHTDINWVTYPWPDLTQLLTEGKIDAFMVGPPYAPEIREKKIGHVLVNTTTDKPWSQYFCCLVASTKAFVRQHPVATKRAAGPAEGGRRVRPGAGAHRPTHRRQRPGAALRRCPAGAEGDPIRPVAAVRSRGRGALLRAVD